MRQPSTPEVILEVLLAGAISEDQARHYLANYRYYERQWSDLERNHAGRWAASLNGQIYLADSLIQAQQEIEHLPHTRTAYIEQVKAT